MELQSSWQNILAAQKRRWLVTGAAGFIGSHLVEQLLAHGQVVRGLDNLATGFRRNLFAGSEFLEGDIRDLETCRRACSGVDIVLHQAALGSVPRSIERPLDTHGANVDGFVNMLVAARDAGVPRFVYASSSSVYGDEPGLPKLEDRIGTPLSPYAVSKRINELYAETFQRHYGIQCVGLRYFNVFGARQDPNGAYAAVIPRWFATMIKGEACVIHGDGETSRDFCHVLNVVQANVLAALTGRRESSRVYNVAFGERTTLKELHRLIRERVLAARPGASPEPVFKDFRPGDVRHSLADISRAQKELGYAPSASVVSGLDQATGWYLANATS